MAMHSELWFPSVIWSAIIHCIDNLKLKEYAYERKKHDKGRAISNYIGYQSNDIKLGECEEIDNLIDYTNKEINTISLSIGLKIPVITNVWLNINPYGSYNYLHNHQSAIFSGVYYVNATPNQGNIQFERSDGAEYFLPDNPDKITYYSATRATYAAKTGALYIFPGWLKHSVQGNVSNSDRISISFNYGN